MKALVQRQHLRAVAGLQRAHGADLDLFNSAKIGICHITAGLRGRHAFQLTAHGEKFEQSLARHPRDAHCSVRQHLDAAFGDEVPQGCAHRHRTDAQLRREMAKRDRLAGQEMPDHEPAA